MIGLIANVGPWPAKTFVWTRVTQDLRNGGPVEMLSKAKPIKIKVPIIASVFAFNV